MERREPSKVRRTFLKPRYLGLVFVLAVILPSCLLAALSIRAAAREEAFIEQQLRTALLAEVTHAAGLASQEVRSAAEELRSSLPALPADPAAAFSRWKAASPLVDVPFLLSPRYVILWPAAPGGLAAAERAFLEENAGFLSDRTPTQIYRNIALVYQNEILDEARAAAPPAARAPEAEADLVPAAPERREQGAAQKALDTFAQSESVRESVYAEALKKGDTVGKRVVAPAPQARNAPAVEQRSELVSEPVRLSRIAAGSPFGIIPRFVGERLTFLFYMKMADGRIAGCRMDAGRFRERIAGVVPGTWTPARILVILDDTGTPLAAPPASEGRDWRRPFVSREIGETLPRWEAASYLTNPSAVAARARTSALLIALLVVILFASVAGGGALVLTSLASETRLARNKATFVTNVSHELKTPLTSIRLFVQLLRQGRQRDPAKAGEYLERIESETERLTRLINSVLDFSALERGVKRYQRGRVDLGELCQASVEAERPRLAAGGFVVSLALPAEPVEVEADGEAIKQVLLNLLSNAEKYSPVVREIGVEVARDGQTARLAVRDRGAGVPERHRERIFQEFFRVDDSLTARVKGTGLGLTIARRIARDHGGEVTCGPREGGGSVFTVTLPCREEAARVKGEGE